MAVAPIRQQHPTQPAGIAVAGNELLLIGIVGDRKFALPAASIERVVQMVRFTPVSDRDPLVAGILNVRGDTVSVVDPRPRLGIGAAVPRADHHLILMSSEPRFAVWVDRVERVVVPGPGDVQHLDDKHDGGSVLRLETDLIPVVPVHDLAPYPDKARNPVPT
jgi:chemotaxis signal transduction protein